ncbi:MAG: glycine betaine ABC transporter substrate-binding protein [Roseiflexaceae bacterium]
MISIRVRMMLALTLLLAFVLAACGNATPQTGNATAPAATAEVPAATAAATAAVAPTTAAPTAATGATAAPTAATGASPATGTGAKAGEPIKIGSKDFTEAILVAELYAQVLEDNGFTVERKLNLGGTPIAHAALLSADIDLYPEYTSTGLLTILKQPALKDPNEILSAVKQGYEQQFNLTWLERSPFNDSQGLATTKEIAEKYSIKTYSDLAKKAGELRLGGPAEFAEREDGVKGLQAAYGDFQFAEFKQLGTGALRYDALQNGDIDVVVVATTDARIAADGLVVLEDDKSLYPIYNIAPVIRQDTLAANPKIAEALAKLAPLLTDPVITGLNAQVDIDGKEPTDVARTFLQESGILTK